jgi:hypothetical protein
MFRRICVLFRVCLAIAVSWKLSRRLRHGYIPQNVGYVQ